MGVGIEVKDLNAWFGKAQVLKEINIKVGANAVTAVIGPSGCGKSTFIRCLNRMHEIIPESARSRFSAGRRHGSLRAGQDAVDVRRRIGMVFQKPNPFPTMSIYDNVAAGLRLNGYNKRREIGCVGGAFAPYGGSLG